MRLERPENWLLAIFAFLIGVGAAAALSPEQVVQSLNEDRDLAGYGPYTLLAGEKGPWRLIAKGPPLKDKTLFEKAALQSSLLLVRHRPRWGGLILVESGSWRASISAPQLIDAARGQNPRALPVRELQASNRGPLLLHPELSFERLKALRVPSFFNRQAIPQLQRATLARAQEVGSRSWAYRSLRFIEERYGLEGEQPLSIERSFSRGAFAERLNAALLKLLDPQPGDLAVDRSDLAALRQLQVDFESELAFLTRERERQEVPGQTPSTKATLPMAGVTYRCSVLLPVGAGRGIAQLLVDFPANLPPSGRESVRLLVADRPVVARKVELTGRQYSVSMRSAVPPGSELTLEIQGVSEPPKPGLYAFGLTVLPEGTLPAYYELPGAKATFAPSGSGSGRPGV